MRKKRILFIHQGKAGYPEIRAYREFFADEFDTAESTQERASLEGSRADVLWYIMGFYPRKIPAAVIVHDYRSLSVGKGAALRDRLKRWLNHRPSLRVFLNREVKEELAFTDGVPSIEIDMGVPAFAKSIRGRAPDAGSRFCYIGELSRERDTHLMIASFLRHATGDDRFLLVGPCETKIAAEFASRSNLVFTGRVSQERALEYVASSDIAVCFVPNRRPYHVQTPTKLLEYAALGKPILANACPSILQTAKRYGIRVLGADDDLFAPVAAGAVVQDNHDFDAARVTWSVVLEQANVRSAINTALVAAS